MSDAFESIQNGLLEAIAFAKGQTKGAVVHQFDALDVKSVRQNLEMTQNEFASKFGVSVATLRHWERGDRTPRGPALVLLNVLAKDPVAVMKALN